MQGATQMLYRQRWISKLDANVRQKIEMQPHNVNQQGQALGSFVF